MHVAGTRECVHAVGQSLLITPQARRMCRPSALHSPWRGGPRRCDTRSDRRRVPARKTRAAQIEGDVEQEPCTVARESHRPPDARARRKWGTCNATARAGCTASQRPMYDRQTHWAGLYRHPHFVGRARNRAQVAPSPTRCRGYLNLLSPLVRFRQQ
eukprot:SAG11_NODE_571_length_8451_cov_34.938218_10_plen_157_part_00